ncbi:MAG: hypothetical protein M1833_004125 [Piccolia ochrophora]|nr:MAG: hypothetical protein M1833_004125 [Piccolia ochrophora]
MLPWSWGICMLGCALASPTSFHSSNESLPLFEDPSQTKTAHSKRSWTPNLFIQQDCNNYRNGELGGLEYQVALLARAGLAAIPEDRAEPTKNQTPWDHFFRPGIDEQYVRGVLKRVSNYDYHGFEDGVPNEGFNHPVKVYCHAHPRAPRCSDMFISMTFHSEPGGPRDSIRICPNALRHLPLANPPSCAGKDIPPSPPTDAVALWAGEYTLAMAILVQRLRMTDHFRHLIDSPGGSHALVAQATDQTDTGYLPRNNPANYGWFVTWAHYLHHIPVTPWDTERVCPELFDPFDPQPFLAFGY